MANVGSNDVSVLLNNGSGFATATNFMVGNTPRSVAVGDINGDGKPDLAVANANSSNVSVLLNTGSGRFGAATSYPVGTTPFSVAVVDVNGDNKPDLATANFSGNNVSVLINCITKPLTLALSASPDKILTTGTTTLSATVSEGTAPYSYTFAGSSGIITPSGNTASVSGLTAGIQTFTVVVSDATTPTSQTLSAMVSVTVTQANTAPVATNNASQTATVGTAFSYTVNAFTDAETPNSLTYSASINPANGLSFNAVTRVISGTPTSTSPSSVTIVATDPGSLSATTTFTITPGPRQVTALLVTLTANPTTILTTGTAALSATASGAPRPTATSSAGPVPSRAAAPTRLPSRAKHPGSRVSPLG